MHIHEGHEHHDIAHKDEISKDVETLKVLFDHWIEHNKSHEESFRKWAKKAKAMGKDTCSDWIEKAADLLLKASEALVEAKKSF
ncbi:hypothetical protein TKV_c19790 [Thermoanaerobacter kivui]|uniref:DUF8180 domain-containing protein n=1 Tax=Thermoanaerobacter kivui TaxID=2325 RepID=A0A097ATI3_THEKI|nr:hypothetical protein [Thermoanaerobacter kivui]AIS53123.1 hypothetical protein TKV_c19790 [Thermoanaerobacter kivui]